MQVTINELITRELSVSVVIDYMPATLNIKTVLVHYLSIFVFQQAIRLDFWPASEIESTRD